MSPVSTPVASGQPEVSLSIVALVFGVLSLFLGALTALPGIVLGHVAYSRIKHNPYRFGGTKLALTGLALCYLAFAISLVLIVYVFSDPIAMHYLADYFGYSLLLAER